MKTKEEQIKKQILEDRQNHEAFVKAQEALQKEALRTTTLLNENDSINNPEEDEKEVLFAVSELSNNTLDWQNLVEDYAKKYPQFQINNNTLQFPTQEDAINFFAEQAAMEPPRKFLAREVDTNGMPTGFNVFSCGDKILYKGTLDAILDQLKAAQKEKPNDQSLLEGIAVISRMLNPNPTQDFRSSLQGNKNSEDTVGQTNSPNPLSTSPIK